MKFRQEKIYLHYRKDRFVVTAHNMNIHGVKAYWDYGGIEYHNRYCLNDYITCGWKVITKKQAREIVPHIP